MQAIFSTAKIPVAPPKLLLDPTSHESLLASGLISLACLPSLGTITNICLQGVLDASILDLTFDALKEACVRVHAVAIQALLEAARICCGRLALLGELMHLTTLTWGNVPICAKRQPAAELLNFKAACTVTSFSRAHVKLSDHPYHRSDGISSWLVNPYYTYCSSTMVECRRCLQFPMIALLTPKC